MLTNRCHFFTTWRRHGGADNTGIHQVVPLMPYQPSQSPEVSGSQCQKMEEVEDEESQSADLSEEFGLQTKELGPDVLNDSKFDPLLTPFDMMWTFGFDVSIPVINLTTSHRREIFYSAANTGILYDYCKKKMTHLRGHQHKIAAVSSDKSGRWLVTADNGKDNVIMVWDTYDCSVVWTIFSYPGPGYEILKVALSPNAKLLITVTNKNTTTIDFWLWTYGNEAPDDSYTDDRELGKPKIIQFHPNKEEHFMVIFEKAVLFFCWNYETKKVSRPTTPKVTTKYYTGHHTNGTYVDFCHECFVSTSRGNVLVFGNTIFTRPFNKEEKMDNEKIYVKCITIAKGHIGCITSIDETIVTGDVTGTIMFFDKRLKLLYWFSKNITSSIASISFKRWPRFYKFQEGGDDDDEDCKEIPDCEDRSEEYETLMKNSIPTDATLQKKPFVARDFFISTYDGTIYLINFPKKQFLPIFSTADSHVAAIDVHDEKPFIIVGYSRGRVTLFNYETHEEVMSTHLPEAGDATITTIKYSPQCLHLACGRSNGELWLLHPALLAQIYVEPFRFSEKKVMKIAFSHNSLQMAYHDDNMTVYGFYYDPETEDWVFKGKVRSHYKEICNILFLDEEPYGLFTIGKDRNIIKYTDLVADEEEIDISIRDRIEQKDIPVYFIPYFKGKFSKSGYFLIVDDKHKYKVLSVITNMCTGVYLGPAYGCFQNYPVLKMEFIPKSNKKYLVFMTKKQIGIQMAPIDGNPFKFVGCLGHPEELIDFRISNCGHYIFTIGKNDRTVFMWKAKPSSVERMHQLGGVELQPFYCLLEGGRGGFLYQEMKDLFYYMQILQQGEDVFIPRVVSNSINIGELPDLMRACGYYPSEYEIENLLTDIRYKEFDDTGVLKDKATFCDFVKLFINHKPAYGYTVELLEKSFETASSFADGYGASDMTREDFIDALTTTGEQMSVEQAFRCMTRLLHEEAEEGEMGERDFSFMADSVDFYYLMEDLLGLDMDSYERRYSDETNASGSY